MHYNVFVDTGSDTVTRKKPRKVFAGIVDGHDSCMIVIPKISPLITISCTTCGELYGILKMIQHVKQNYDFEGCTIVCDCESAVNYCKGIAVPRTKNNHCGEATALIKQEIDGHNITFMHMTSKECPQISYCDMVGRRMRRFALGSKEDVAPTIKQVKKMINNYPDLQHDLKGYDIILV